MYWWAGWWYYRKYKVTFTLSLLPCDNSKSRFFSHVCEMTRRSSKRRHNLSSSFCRLHTATMYTQFEWLQYLLPLLLHLSVWMYLWLLLWWQRNFLHYNKLRGLYLSFNVWTVCTAETSIKKKTSRWVMLLHLWYPFSMKQVRDA